MNHDTITSLHNFMQTAKLLQKSMHGLPASGIQQTVVNVAAVVVGEESDSFDSSQVTP